MESTEFGLDVRDIGVVRYAEALSLQLELLKMRADKKIPDTLLITEHEPVVTFGRGGGKESVTSEAFFRERNIPFVPSGRGGGVTYHGPGQLLLYPIIDLSEKKKNIALYMDILERTLIDGLNDLGVPARKIQGKRGAWVEDKKIAFLGVAVKNWVTYHGASININNDTSAFLRMDPCGEAGMAVTSAKEWLGEELDMGSAKKVFSRHFAEVLREGYSVSGSECKV